MITISTVVLLTIMALAYLFTSSLEQSTARASVNRIRAELAAQSAVNSAIAMLLANLNTYPDSATSWDTVKGNSGTFLFYHDQAPEVAAAAANAATLYVHPLFSGATPQLAAAKDATLATTLDDTNSFNFNHARFAGDTQGWIGAPPGAGGTTPPPFRGQWLNITDTDGKVAARYAFWVEDESFKVNVNLMGNTPRGSGTLGDNPNQIPLQGLVKEVLGAADLESVASDIFGYRAGFRNARFFEFPALNHVPGQSGLSESVKFISTIYSGAMNLSRSGSRRANLNEIVTTTTAGTEIRRQLDQIITAITYHLPDFGQRFYRAGGDLNAIDVSDSGTTRHRTIYLNKLAANIRDYIDTDSQPTILNNDGNFSVRIGPPPSGATWTTPPSNSLIALGGGTAGSNEIIAIGKEGLPLIQEYALRIRQVAFAPRTGPLANYTISIDHYIEVWNSSNQDITVNQLGPSPFLLIANQPGWDAGTLDDIPEGQPRDIKIPLPAWWVFPAGQVIAITTDPELLPALTPNASKVYQVTIPEALRTYSGRTDRKSGSNLRLNMDDRTTSSSDYETELIFGNDLGVLESSWGGAAIGSAISINIDGPENRLDETKYHFRGASLRGNSGASFATTGDPRTNAEQLRLDLNGAAAANDKTRYFSSGLQDNSVPANSSLGAPNSNFVTMADWPDYTLATESASAAPGVITNSNLVSIGQLGDIFDPARARGDSNDITLSRGGGRTFKIGQPDRFDSAANRAGLWDGNSTTRSREWAAWRLADVFSTNDSITLEGRINVNSAGRDNGAALKAALYGYVFRANPESDPQIAGLTLDDSVVQNLVGQLKARIVNDASTYGQFSNTSGPLLERGELSEMPIFNPGTDLSTSASGSVHDRGREELFRRMAELITTRGNVFTVYSVGQALIPQPTGTTPRVAATSRSKITFRIDPQWTGTPPSDPFDPSNPTARFRKPDRYVVNVLYAGE